MDNKPHRITGNLIDRLTRHAVPGLQVEAWDKDHIFDGPVGSSVSSADGAFKIQFDELHLTKLFGARRPDLYFKVFAGERVLMTTERTVTWSIAGGAQAIMIEIDSPASEQPPPARDPEIRVIRVIRGRVLPENGRPPPEVTLRAFDKNMRSEALLGEAQAGADGSYEIAYKAAQLGRVSKSNADLVIRAFAKDGSLLAASETLFQARSPTTVDLSIPGQAEPESSEYEELAGKLTSALGVVSPAELTEDDIAYLAGTTQSSAHLVEIYAHSAQHARETDLPPEVVYGLIRAGQPAVMPALLETGPDAQRDALESAIKQNIIPSRFQAEIDTALEQLRQLRIRRALETPARPGRVSLGEILQIVTSSSDVHKKVAEALLQRSGAFEAVGSTLQNHANFQAPGLIEDVQRVLHLAALTGNHAPLIRRLEDLRRSGTISSPRDLAKLGRDDWAHLLKQQLDGSPMSLPPDVEGATDEERIQNYAATLARAVEDVFPTAVIADLLTRPRGGEARAPSDVAQFSGNTAVEDLHPMAAGRPTQPQGAELQGRSDLKRFFANSPDFDLGAASVTHYLAQNRDRALAGVEDPARLAGDLGRVQRIFKVTPRSEEITALMTAGHSSAQSIALMGKAGFLKATGSTLASDTAEKIYDRAASISAAALAVYGAFSPALNNVSTAATANARASAPAAFAGASPAPVDEGYLTDLVDLLGKQGYCACEHCCSVYSPAAYLVDLLHFVKAPQTALVNRRPDLVELELSCENTNTLLPYIDLVNEVLENAVSPRKPMNGKIPWPQTTWTSEELAASPEHVIPEAYTALASAVYPWNLPFELAAEEPRVYLKQIGVRRYDLMRTFRRIPANPVLESTPSEALIAAEHLGLSAQDLKIITAALYMRTVRVATTGTISLASHQSIDGVALADGDRVLVKNQADGTKNGIYVVTPTNWNRAADADENASVQRGMLVQVTEGATLKGTGWVLTPSGTVGQTALTFAQFNTPGQIDATDHQPYTYWGYDSGAQNTWLASLTNVGILLKQSGLSYAELLELLETDFINPELKKGSNGNPIVVQFKDTTCDLSTAILSRPKGGDSLKVEDANRIHRFVRLRRKLGWTTADLDCVIRALQPLDITDAFVVQLSDLVHVTEGTNIPLRRLLSLWAPLDTVAQPDGGPSVYASIFQDKTVLGMQDRDAFALDKLAGKIAMHAPAMLAVLEINAADLSLLIDDTTTLNLANLSRVYGTVILARALKRSIRDVLAFKAISGIDPFGQGHVRDTRVFIEKIEAVEESGFSIEELDEILRGVAPASGSTLLTQPLALQVLNDLYVGLLQITDSDRRASFIAQRLGSALAVDPPLASALLSQFIKASKTAMDDLLDRLKDPSFIASLPLKADSASFTSALWPMLLRLAKAARIVNRLRIQTGELTFDPSHPAIGSWIAHEGLALGWLDFNALPVAPLPTASALFNAWDRMRTFFALRGRLDVDGVSLLKLLSGDSGDRLGALSSLCGWSSANLSKLVGPTMLDLKAPVDFADERWLSRLATCFDALRGLGISLIDIVPLAYGGSGAPAAIARSAAKARYDEATWSTVGRPLRDTLREQQRSALISYLVHTAGFADANTLSYHFLIDVEMGASQLTSRIKQAISSVQMFIQRVLMNLESDPAAGVIDPKQWQWLRNYRVWEANRKVFLYPENWIEPALRDDKTPFFEELENDLLQGDVTADRAEAVLLTYLEKLDGAAHLEIAGMYEDDDSRILHVLARTKTSPRAYYHRTRANKRWAPWEPVDLDIDSEWVTPVVWHSRLYVFWLIFEEVRDKNATDPKAPPSSYEMRLAWSERKNGGWSRRRVSQDSLVGGIWTPKDAFYFLRPMKFSEDELRLEVGMAKPSYTTTYSGPTDQDPAPNQPSEFEYPKPNHFSAAQIASFESDWPASEKPSSPDPHANPLTWTEKVSKTATTSYTSSPDVSQTVTITATRISHWTDVEDGPNEPDDVNWTLATKLETTTTLREHAYFSIRGCAAEAKGVDFTQVQVELLLPDGVEFNDNALLEKSTQPGELVVLKQLAAGSSVLNVPVLKKTHGPSGSAYPFRVVYPMQRTGLLAHEPFFYADGAHTFFVHPDDAAAPPGSTLDHLLKFELFYHPYVCDFVQILNRYGLDGLFGEWSGSGWSWSDQGTPSASVTVRSPMGAITVMNSPKAPQRPYVFVRGSDDHLWVTWWTGSAWAWHDQGTPSASVSVNGPVGTATVMDSPTSSQRPYAFVRGSDGHLWLNRWTGSRWSWYDQGAPAVGVSVSGPLGVVTVMDSPASAQRPYAFVQSSDGHLWVNWWSGSSWSWADQGKPAAGVNVAGPVGVITVMDSPAAAQRPYAFVRGSDGHLWLNRWTGSKWSWSDQGTPSASVSVNGPVGAITVKNSPGSAQRPYVFVIGSDGHLWLNQWTGSSWAWTDQGAPATGVSVGGALGATIGMDSPTSFQRPYVFVQGTDGHYWLHWWNGSQWLWLDQGAPAGATAGGMSVATAMAITAKDSATSPQRPYAFARSSDGHLSMASTPQSKAGWKPPLQLSRRTFFSSYSPVAGTVSPDHPMNEVDFSDRGAYASYNWEFFFHAPLLIAQQLRDNQRFEEAQHWFHFMFDPTNKSSDQAPRRFWKVRPFYEASAPKSIDELLALLSGNSAAAQALKDQIAAWMADPFNPHLIARMRPAAYQRAVVMKYIDNLIDWADQLFRRDTLETLNEATLLYILVSQLLGPRPTEAPQFAKGATRTFSTLGTLDEFANRLVQIENHLPAQGSAPVPASEAIQVVVGSPSILYFCIPPNEMLLGYWDTIEDRLFKLRHSLNIDGVPQKLPLFEPPIDPALLVRARAAGMDLQDVLNDLGAYATRPIYRFQFMVQRAAELCAEVRGLGAALLSALEKRDAEDLALLRAKHEIDVLSAVRQVKAQQIQEAQAALDGLVAARAVTETRREYYRDIARISANEQAYVSSLETAHTFNMAAQGLHDAASVAYLVPDAVAGTLFAGIIKGGSHSGQSLQAAADVFGMVSAQYQHEATMASVNAQYERRWDDWKLQERLAERELSQIDKQILAAQIRLAIAENELAVQDRQIDNARDVDAYMRDKFTSKQLYNWMVSQLSAIYFQSYHLAYDLAKRAERSFVFERKNKPSFIAFGYWDSLKKGLLAGERLSYDLKRMEAAYLEQNTREYEITKHISLAELDPVALLKLRQNGFCFVSLGETAFDRDFPGHYMRRIKTVSLTIPGVSGPYTGVHCTLTLVSHAIRLNDKLNLQPDGYAPVGDDDDRFEKAPGGQSIALSGAQNDSGMFELSLHDERYLPFEGVGAISVWKIDLPKDTNRFDFDTISDVVMHLRYTARDGHELLQSAARKSLGLQPIASASPPAPAALPPRRLFSAAADFPVAFRAFLLAEGSRTLEIDLSEERFPYHPPSTSIGIKSVKIFFNLAGSKPDPTDLWATLTSPKSAATLKQQFENDSDVTGLSSSSFNLAGNPGRWELQFKKADLPSDLYGTGDDSNRLDPQKVRDILILCTYSV